MHCFIAENTSLFLASFQSRFLHSTRFVFIVFYVFIDILTKLCFRFKILIYAVIIYTMLTGIYHVNSSQFLSHQQLKGNVIITMISIITNLSLISASYL